MNERDTRPIALIGLMGAGKSAVGRALGARLGGRAEDLDLRIESAAGATVAEIFAREGEAGFRAREKAALAAALTGAPAVIACGGGVVLDPANRLALREQCRVVWLEVTPTIAARRIVTQPTLRPALGAGPVEGRLEALLRERGALYESMAELRVESGDETPDQIAERIVAGLTMGAT